MFSKCKNPHLELPEVGGGDREPQVFSYYRFMLACLCAGIFSPAYRSQRMHREYLTKNAKILRILAIFANQPLNALQSELWAELRLRSL